MTKVRALRKDTLPEAPGRPGITRHLALGEEDFLVVRSRVDQPPKTVHFAQNDRRRNTRCRRHGTSDPFPDCPTLGDLGTIGSKKV